MNCRFKFTAMAFVAFALLLSGCTKEICRNGDEVSLSFSAKVPGMMEVKSAATESVEDFFAMGYTGTEQWFPKSGTSPKNVILSGGSRTFNDYLWKEGESKTFFAYSNNVPASVASATITKDGVSLAYTAIPSDAANQKDVVLGRYCGDGNNTGTAAMNFYHPLAQVVFKVGDITGVSAITKIEIEGVFDAGNTILTASTTTSGTPEVAGFIWNGTGGSATVSQTVSGSLPSEGSQVGIPFMLIPQDLADKNVNIKVTFTIGGEPKTLFQTLSSGAFQTGKTTICTLSIGSNLEELVCIYLTDADDDIFGTVGGVEYVEIAGLKWAKENLAITESGKRKWKGSRISGDTGHIVGDYFQWAAYENYTTPADLGNGETDRGLLVYTSFTNSYCVDGGTTNTLMWKNGCESLSIAPYSLGSQMPRTYTKYNQKNDTLEAFDDAANIILGGSWRIPSIEDIEALYNATKWTWDNTDKGCYVTEKDVTLKSDKSNALLFFPASGHVLVNGFSDVGSNGYLFSRTLGSKYIDIYYSQWRNQLYFNSYGCSYNGSERNIGIPIRPVSN